MSKPKVLHVYRFLSGTVEGRGEMLSAGTANEISAVYLGEYAPRGPVVAERWEVRTNSFSPFVALSRESASSMADHYANSGINTRIVHITTRKACR